MDFELSSSSSSDEGQWSPSSSPIHQEMDATDRLSHSNKKRSLDHSSDDDDDPEGGASDNESVDDHRNIDAPIDSSSLLLLSTAKSSRTRRVVGLAMSRLSELERIKQGRKFTPEESREYKKLKRQRQNRDAAANSRKKKKQKLDSLEVLVNGFKRQNDELIAKLTEALKENQSLKEALEAFKKQANGDAFHSTATISVKEGPSSSTLSSPPSSSPSVCSSSAVSSISEHSVPTAGRMESFINHSVESAWLYTNNAVLRSIHNHAENVVDICCPAG